MHALMVWRGGLITIDSSAGARVAAAARSALAAVASLGAHLRRLLLVHLDRSNSRDDGLGGGGGGLCVTQARVPLASAPALA